MYIQYHSNIPIFSGVLKSGKRSVKRVADSTFGYNLLNWQIIVGRIETVYGHVVTRMHSTDHRQDVNVGQ